MIRLIKEEFKKIFHNKLNIFLIVVMILYPWYLTYKGYHKGLNLNGMSGPVGIENADASKSNLELLQEVDENTHAMAGELNQAKIDEIYNKGFAKLKEFYKLSNLHKEWMIEQYGKDYLDYIERGSRGELTEQEISELVNQKVNYIDFRNEGNKYFLKVMMNNHGQIRFIVQQYLLDFLDLTFYLGDGDFSTLHETSISDSLVTQVNHNYFDNIVEHSDNPNGNPSQWLIASEMEKKIDYQFDSVYPNKFLEHSLSNFSFFLLLILAYITSSIFSVEHQRKTEPIIFTNKKGKDVYQAKLLTGLILACGVAVITIIGILIQSYIFLPVRDFGLYDIVGMHYFNGNCSLLFTFGHLFIVEVITIILSYMVVSMLTMGISCVNKSSLFSFAIIVLICVVPFFIPTMPEKRLLHGIFPGFTVSAPIAISTILDCFIFNDHLYFNVYIGWALYLAISLVIWVVVNKIGKKHQA